MISNLTRLDLVIIWESVKKLIVCLHTQTKGIQHIKSFKIFVEVNNLPLVVVMGTRRVIQIGNFTLKRCLFSPRPLCGYLYLYRKNVFVFAWISLFSMYEYQFRGWSKGALVCAEGSNFLHFHAVFGRIVQNIRFGVSVSSHPLTLVWRILDPTLQFIYLFTNVMV